MQSRDKATAEENSKGLNERLLDACFERDRRQKPSKFQAIAKIIAGVALMIVAVIALIAWLAACFGTVIVGIALLLLAPRILLLPLSLIGTPAMALIAIGMEELAGEM
jgi:hypothetical protein